MAPKSQSKNNDKGSPNDSNDGGYSYIQKTVCLYDWWLVKAEKDFEGKRLAVAGSTSRESKAVRLFTSSPIVKRYDVFTLDTADGICVYFKGFIDKERTLKNGFPPEVFNHFCFGFPPYWELYAKERLGETLATDIELEVTPDASESARDSEPSLISTRSMRKKVVIQDKHVQMSSVENPSEGSDVINHAVNLSIKVKERSSINIGIDVDHLNNVTVQTTADVDVLNASDSNSLAANLPSSTEKRINHSPSIIETGKVNVRTKKNKVNANPHIPGKRITRSQIQITNGSHEKSPEVGCSKMQKSRVSTKKVQDKQNLNLSILSSVPSRLTPVKGTCSPCKETQRKLDFDEVVVNVRKKSNMLNPHTPGNRITRSQIQITNISQRKNPEVGCSKTQKGRASTKKVQVERKLNRSVPLRKLDFEKIGSTASPKRERKQSAFSPKSLSFKCSRSGRVLLPPLEFWRNQSPVYDQNRGITGIKEEVVALKPSGSRSKAPKRQKL